MSIKSELDKLRRALQEHLEASQPREVYRHVTWHKYLGPMSEAQLATVAHNRSLKHPARVGFSLITIDPHPPRESLADDPQLITASNDLAN